MAATTISHKKKAVTVKKRSIAVNTKASKESTTSHKDTVTLPVKGIDGKANGTVHVPSALFDAKVNKPLMAQAVRVYLSNQRVGGASTKTRGEVEGSTRKIYRQKGTGRARHGAIRAPIFVGGGIAFGPKPHDFHQSMPAKMKVQALASALTSQRKEGHVTVVDGLGSQAPKTKQFAQIFAALEATKKALLVIPSDVQNVQQGAKNLPFITIVPAHSLNTYMILTHHDIICMKEALPVIEKTFLSK